MDPTTCMKAFMDALNEGKLETAREHAENLSAWLATGGFPPDGYNRQAASWIVDSFICYCCDKWEPQ